MRDLFPVLPQPLMRPFVLVFNPQLPRQRVLDYLDTRPEILNWQHFFSNAVFIISDHTVQQLGQIFREGFPNVFFFLAEIHPGQFDGWLYPQSWDFINNPRSSGRWR